MARPGDPLGILGDTADAAPQRGGGDPFGILGDTATATLPRRPRRDPDDPFGILSDTASGAPGTPPIEPHTLATRVRAGAPSIPSVRADVTRAPLVVAPPERPRLSPQQRGVARGSAEDEALHQAPLPVRLAEDAGEFVTQALPTNYEMAVYGPAAPLVAAGRTAGGIAQQVGHAAVGTFLAPVEGTEVTLNPKTGLPSVPGLAPGTIITEQNTPGAIPRREFELAAAQTAANAGSIPLGSGASAVLDRTIGGAFARRLSEQGFVDIGKVTAQREGIRQGAEALGSAIGTAPIGAAYDPEHPVEGALALAALGPLLAPLHEVGKPIVRETVRGAREVGTQVVEGARRIREESARRRAVAKLGDDFTNPSRTAPPPPPPAEQLTGAPSPPGAPPGAGRAPEAPPIAPPEAQAPPPPPTPQPGAETAAPGGFRRRLAETIDPTISQQLRRAEASPVSGLPGRAPFDRALPAAEANPTTAIVRFDVNGTKAVNDALGHPFTDAHVLRQVPASLGRAAAELHLPARFFHLSGDEFAAIVPADQAEAFRARAQEVYGVREHAPGITSSLSGGVGATEQEADAAAYRQKAADKAAQGIGGREGASTSVRTVPLSEIDVEPERFQFKQGLNPKTGAGRELHGVEPFNPDLAGVVTVWRDPADGRLKVVNGHHRYALAKRAGQPTLDVREIQAPDAQAALQQGALVNIAEGHGTALDAAKLFRDTRLTPADVAAKGVSLRGQLAERGLALSKLDPELFGRVARGDVPEDVGVAVGSVLDRPEQQRAAVDLIQRSGRRVSPAEAENVAKQVRDAGSEAVSQQLVAARTAPSRSQQRVQEEPVPGRPAGGGPPAEGREPPAHADEPASLGDEDAVAHPEARGARFFDAAGKETPARDLFGNASAPEEPQGSLVGAKAGTAASRSLAQTEADARAQLPALREQFARETDRTRRAALAVRIARLDAFVNRAGKIGPAEMATRAAAERPARRPEDQQSLLDVTSDDAPIAGLTREALGTTPAEAAELRSLTSIGRGLAEAVGVPLRQGRFNARRLRARGVFFVKSEVARVVRFDMLDTASHEIGHYLSKKYGLTDALPEGALPEITRMGKAGGRAPGAAGHPEEGVAQWFKFRVTDPARALREAPIFSARMEQLLAAEPFLRTALDQARDDFARYQAAPPNARIAAMISTTAQTRLLPTVRGIITSWFDDLHEFRVAEREIAGASGGETSSEARKSAYTLARLSRGSAGLAEEMVERGIGSPTDPAAARRSRGVGEVLREVGRDRVSAFREYLVAERVLEKSAQGIDTGFDPKDAEAVARAGREEFGDAAKAIWQYSRALIEYLRDAGLLTAAEAKQIIEKNQKRVPFYREFAEDETAGGRGGGGKRFAKNSAGVMRMKGSGRPIIDPLESLVKDTYHAARAVQQHRVAQALVRMAKQTEGSGHVIERLTERPQRAVRIPVERVLDQLEDLGFKPPADLTPEQAAELMGSALTGFEDLQVGGAAEAKDLVIPMIENGKREWYAVRDRALYDALQGLGTQLMPSWLRWLSVSARTKRAGATLTLEFLGRNPVRDAWDAAIYSRAGFRPPGVDFARGMFHALRQDGVYQRWRLAGGDNAAMLGLDRPVLQRHLDEIMRKPSLLSHAADVVRHPIDTLRLLSSLGENATRLGEFQAVERRQLAGGASAGEAATQGAFAARDVTLDFARAGTQARMVNQIVAFFNANLQGSAKLVMELRTRPQVIIPRALAAITLPSIALYLMNRNDPAYQELPEWQKDTFWIIPQRDAQGRLQHLWRIPKPFELGLLFGTVPERILRQIERDDPDAFHEIGNRFAQTFSPISWPPVGSALSPLVENWANKDSFTGRPIVPASAQHLVPREQAAPHTGEFARQVGRAAGVSPAKVEHLVTGYGAGLGTIALGAANLATREARQAVGARLLTPPTQRHEQDPLAGVAGVRGFVARPPGANAESIDRFYDAYAQAEAARQTYGSLLKQRRGAEARAFLDAHREELTGHRAAVLRGTKSEMDGLAKALRGLHAGTQTPERTARIEALQQRMIAIARHAIGRGPLPVVGPK